MAFSDLLVLPRITILQLVILDPSKGNEFDCI